LPPLDDEIVLIIKFISPDSVVKTKQSLDIDLKLKVTTKRLPVMEKKRKSKEPYLELPIKDQKVIDSIK